MNNPQTDKGTDALAGTSASSVPRDVVVSERDLPLHCPTRDMSLWNAHPRVFLPIEETGHATCPYCGTEFTLQR